jgi:hypothetical protein
VGIIFKGSGFYITDNRQVSSPTLTAPKELDKPRDKQEKEPESAKSEGQTPKDSTADTKSNAKKED